MSDKELIAKALQARLKSYSPYSNYCVGAAIECADGTIFCGCNVENATYGATNCAERTTIFKAVSEGYRDFVKIAICGGPASETELSDYAYPCGICRQVMREFTNPNEFIVLVARSEDDYKTYLLNELLPDSFGPDYLL